MTVDDLEIGRIACPAMDLQSSRGGLSTERMVGRSDASRTA